MYFIYAIYTTCMTFALLKFANISPITVYSISASGRHVAHEDSSIDVARALFVLVSHFASQKCITCDSVRRPEAIAVHQLSSSML